MVGKPCAKYTGEHADRQQQQQQQQKQQQPPHGTFDGSSSACSNVLIVRGMSVG